MVEERLEVARRLFKRFDITNSGFLTKNEVNNIEIIIIKVPGLLRETYK